MKLKKGKGKYATILVIMCCLLFVVCRGKSSYGVQDSIWKSAGRDSKNVWRSDCNCG